jgi:hypothetical protein
VLRRPLEFTHSPVSAWTSETIGVLSVLPCFNTTRLFASRFFGSPPIVRDTDGQVVSARRGIDRVIHALATV